MTTTHRVRDSKLIDALELIQPVPFKGGIWRVVREGRDVLMSAAAGGRWDDGTFEVLYTSQSADGAVAERYFHLSRGQPVIPSRVKYHLFALHASIEKTLRLLDLETIENLGVDTKRYGSLSYGDRQGEYPRTQEIAETAHFVGFDGLIAPNARWKCMNVVLFSDRVAPSAVAMVKDHGPIDWNKWLAEPFGF